MTILDLRDEPCELFDNSTAPFLSVVQVVALIRNERPALLGTLALFLLHGDPSASTGSHGTIPAECVPVQHGL